jgi:hypothetical protein
MKRFEIRESQSVSLALSLIAAGSFVENYFRIFGNESETHTFAQHVSCSGRRVACDDTEIAAGTTASTGIRRRAELAARFVS